MSVITFLGNGKVETAQTVSMAGIATYLSVEHNYKILLINAKHNDTSLEECFWEQSKSIRKTDLETGISGLIKAIASNKTSPEIITNYTKTIFKDRLELLTDNNIPKEDFEKQKAYMKSIIKIANKYYDLVLVDLEGSIDEPYIQEILEETNLIVVNLTQRIKLIKEFMQTKHTHSILSKNNIIYLMGKYDRFSKYNVKNVERTYKIKDVYGIPYNTAFFEACNEGNLADFFIQNRKLKPTHIQAPIVNAVSEISERLIYRLKELQMQI